MKTLCETPGLRKAGVTAPTMQAAAAAGLKPARTRSGMSVGAMAAQQPAVDGMAIATMPVTIEHAGKSRIPMRRSGFVSRATRCRSHFVSETTAAKPMAEQIAMMSAPLVMDLSNC